MDNDNDQIHQLAARLLEIGNRYKVGELLKNLQGWQLSHKLTLDFTSDVTLARLKDELDDPAVLEAFVGVARETLGWRLELVEARVVERPVDAAIIKEVEEIMLKVEQQAKSWAEVPFGKYQGKTLPQILFLDGDYFFWAYEDALFQDRGNLEKQADEIYNKSRAIRVPQSSEGQIVVEYFIHPISNDFSHFKLVPASRPDHQGASPTIRRPVVDMGLVREIKTYDKSGYRRLVQDIKAMIFGSLNIKLTKSRCEEFFSDDTNFDPQSGGFTECHN